MSKAENRRIARALVEEVLNRRAAHRIPEFVAPECEVHDAPIKGIAFFEEHYRTFVHVYPDVQVSVLTWL